MVSSPPSALQSLLNIRRRSGVFTLGLLLSFADCKHPPDPRPPPEMPDTLQGFLPMQTPRDSLPIGAVWGEMGTVTEGLPESELHLSRSFSELSNEVSENLNASFAFTVAKLAGLDAQLVRDRLVKIDLQNASVVTVRDVRKLRELGDGAAYLWDALKLERFSITGSSSQVASMKERLDVNLKATGVNQSIDAKNENMATLTVTGTNLFLGYRVLRVRAEPLKVLAETEWRSHSQASGNLGDALSLQFDDDAEERNGAWEEPSYPGADCNLRMQVISYRQLDSQQRPLQRNWRVYCWAKDRRTLLPSRKIVVSTRLVASTIQVDYLTAEIHDFAVSNRSLWVTGHFKHEQQIFHLEDARIRRSTF